MKSNTDMKIIAEKKTSGKHKGSTVYRGVTPVGVARFPSVHEVTRGYQDKENPHYMTDLILDKNETEHFNNYLNQMINQFIEEKEIKNFVIVKNVKVGKDREGNEINFFRFKSEYKPLLVDKYTNPLKEDSGEIRGGAGIKVQFAHHEPYSLSGSMLVDGKEKKVVKVGIKLYLTGVQLIKPSEFQERKSLFEAEDEGIEDGLSEAKVDFTEEELY